MTQGRVTAYFRFSKWRPSAILVFHNFAIFVKNSNLYLFLHQFVKFWEGWTIPGRVIAYFWFSKWRPSRPPSWIWYDVLLDHPRLLFDGPNNLLKLHVDWVYTLQDKAIFIFDRFGLKLPIHAPFGEFFVDITPKWIPILSQSQKDCSWAITRRTNISQGLMLECLWYFFGIFVQVLEITPKWTVNPVWWKIHCPKKNWVLTTTDDACVTQFINCENPSTGSTWATWEKYSIT